MALSCFSFLARNLAAFLSAANLALAASKLSRRAHFASRAASFAARSESRCAFFNAAASSTAALTEEESEDIDNESVAALVESATTGTAALSESLGGTLARESGDCTDAVSAGMTRAASFLRAFASALASLPRSISFITPGI